MWYVVIAVLVVAVSYVVFCTANGHRLVNKMLGR